MGNLFSPELLAQISEAAKTAVSATPEANDATTAQVATPLSVEDLYTSILGRPSDAGGLAFWQERFGDTIDPNEVDAFKQSANVELAQRTPAEQQALAPNQVADSASGALSQVTNTTLGGDTTAATTSNAGETAANLNGKTTLRGALSDEQMVRDAYALTGRTDIGTAASNIDQGGFDWWVNALKTGQTTREAFQSNFNNAVADSLMKNPQSEYSAYVTDYLLNTNSPEIAGVNQLYKDVLGRDADAGGLGDWYKQFGTEISPEERAKFEVSAKVELDDRVRGLYSEFLGPERVADQGGVDFWRNAFGSSIDDKEKDSFRQAAATELSSKFGEGDTGLLDGYKYAKSLGVTDEALKKTLGEDLYNQYQNRFKNFAVTNLTNIVADNQLTWQESQQIHKIGTDLGFTPDQLATVTGQDKSVFELANTNYVKGRDLIINGTLTSPSVTTDADRILSTIALQKEYGFTDQEFADVTKKDVNSIKSSLDPVRNFETNFNGLFGNTDTTTGGIKTFLTDARSNAAINKLYGDSLNEVETTIAGLETKWAPYGTDAFQAETLSRQLNAQRDAIGGEYYRGIFGDLNVSAARLVNMGLDTIKDIGQRKKYQSVQAIPYLITADGKNVVHAGGETFYVQSDGEDGGYSVAIPRSQVITRYKKEVNDGEYFGHVDLTAEETASLKDNKFQQFIGSVVYDKDTGQELTGLDNVLVSQKSGGFFTGKKHSLRANFTNDGTPILTASQEKTGFNEFISDVGPIALAIASFIPGPHQPFARLAQAALALDQKNYIGAVLSGFGAYTSYVGPELTALKAAETAGTLSEVAGGAERLAELNSQVSNIKLAQTAVQGFAALEAKNISGLINSGMSAYTQLGGETLPSGVTTTIQLGNFAIALENKQFDAALGALGDLTGSKDLKLAGTAATLVDAIQKSGQTGDFTQVVNAGFGLVNAVKAGSTTGQSGTTNKVVTDAVSSVDADKLEEAGAKTFVNAATAGATNDEALEAAKAVTGVVTNKIADQTANTAESITFTPDTEFGDLEGAIKTNAAADALRAEKLDLISNQPKFSDAFSQARDLLGAGKTFTWNGKEYSTATAAERPDLTGKTIEEISAKNLAANPNSEIVAAQNNFAARDAAEADRLKRQKDATTAIESTSFFTRVLDSIQNQMKLSSAAANDYLKNNPNSPITKSVSTAYEAAGNLQKNIGGGLALITDNKPLSDAFVKSGNDLTKVGQSIGDGVVDTKNWNETVSLIKDAEGWEKVGILAGRFMDGTSGLGRQVEVELRQELPGLFLGGGSVKGILVATGVMDVAETTGNAALETYDESIKKGETHADALSDARKAGGVAGMTEAAIQLTLGKVADLVVGKVGSVASKVGTKVAGEGVVEGAQEGASSLAVNAVLGQELDINKALTQAVVGSAVGKGAATATSPADIVTSDTINTNITSAVSSGNAASVNTAITDSVQTSLSGGSSVEVAVGATVNSAITNGADAASSITSAVTTAVTNGADVNQTVTASVNSAITAGADTSVVIDSTITSAITSGANSSQVVNSAVTSAVSNGADVKASVGTAVTSAVAAGADASTVVSSSVAAAVTAGSDTNTVVGTAVTAAVNSGADVAVVVDSAVTSAVSSGANVDTAVASSVAAAVNSGANVSTAVDAAVTAATNAGNNVTVSTGANTTTITNATTNTSTTVDTKTGATTTVDNTNNVTTTVAGNTTTTVDANNNTTSQTVVDANTQTTVIVDSNANTSTETVVNSNTNTTTSTTVDTNNNTTTETKTDVNNSTQTTVQTDTNTNTQTTVKVNTNTDKILDFKETEIPADWKQPVIESPDVPEEVTPDETEDVEDAEKKTEETTQELAKLLKLAPIASAGSKAGSGAMGLPSDSRLNSKSLGSRETQKAIDPLARVKEAQAELEREVMMNQIDPRLANVMQQRMDPQQQTKQFDNDIGALAKMLSGESPTPDASNSKYYSYGSEDSIDSVLGGAAKTYKDGGFVEPLKASGGMVMPLMAKSGGALGDYGGREDYKGGKHVAGDGDGQSDDIPAWLADGEFVFPADVVSALGNGSTKAGTDKLYSMMHGIRDRARSKGPKDLPPPALKSPLDYLKSSKRSTS